MPVDAKHLAPGAMVGGRYRVEALIAHGGFGSVFRATQVDLGRQVALKVLSGGTPERLERFRREAGLAKQLTHPNTVRLLDFGEALPGVPFIAWELLRGRPLDVALRAEGAFAPERVARIAAQVLKSLMEAHERGIVHRDIKPANVFLCDFEGEPDFVKVVDFGIAKSQPGPAAGGNPAPTSEGHVLGTPEYVPPEYLRGRDASPAGNLYSLGLVIAEALIGRPVFQGTAMEVRVAQISDAPVPIPPVVLASPLGSVVLRATDKRPERRYASAADMLRELVSAAPGGASAHDPGRAASTMAAAQTSVAPALATAPAGFVGFGAAARPMVQMQAPIPAAAPAAARTGGGFSSAVGCLMIGGALTVVGGAVAGAIFYMRASPGANAPAGVASAGGRAGVGADGVRLRDLSADLLRGRLAAAGWTVDDVKVKDGGWLIDTTFNASRGPERAVVQLMKYYQVDAAERFERTLKDNLHAAVRDEATILTASAGGNRKASALVAALSQ